jgi:hypothetical protein
MLTDHDQRGLALRPRQALQHLLAPVVVVLASHRAAVELRPPRLLVLQCVHGAFRPTARAEGRFSANCYDLSAHAVPCPLCRHWQRFQAHEVVLPVQCPWRQCPWLLLLKAGRPSVQGHYGRAIILSSSATGGDLVEVAADGAVAAACRPAARLGSAPWRPPWLPPEGRRRVVAPGPRHVQEPAWESHQKQLSASLLVTVLPQHRCKR